MAIHAEFDKGQCKNMGTANTKNTTKQKNAARIPEHYLETGAAAHSIWFAENECEYGSVKLKDLAQIDQNSAAIAAIASVLTNSISEPDGAEHTTLDAWTTICMLGAIESICSFNIRLVDGMRHESS